MVNVTPELVTRIVKEAIKEIELANIAIGVSSRHVHLTEEDFKKLFPHEELRKIKELRQPGEFAADQTLTVVGPKGAQNKVRILGPFRKQSQVEISMTDARNLGIPTPVRLSGNLDGAAEVTLRNGRNEICIKACIVAKRHIHMSYTDMEYFGIPKGTLLKARVVTDGRTTVFEDVELRPGENFVLEMHIDTDEANTAGVKSDTVASLVRD